MPPAVKWSLSGLLVAALVASPALAHACAVCMSGREDESRTAFILTTAFMTALPLGVIGGAVWWLRRRLRELEGGPSREGEEIGAEAGERPGVAAREPLGSTWGAE